MSDLEGSTQPKFSIIIPFQNVDAVVVTLHSIFSSKHVGACEIILVGDGTGPQLPEIVAKRCRFIIEESQRVLDLAAVLPTDDYGQLAQLFSDSYLGARDLFEIGAPAMELMMQAMQSAPGVIAARQAGGGFGGCLVALVKEDHIDQFSESVHQTYKKSSGIEPQIFPVAASAGAGKLE